MCQRVTCKTCGKPTYSGCGRHIEQVLGDVAVEKRCKCRETEQAQPSSSPPKESWAKRLFGGG